MKPIILKEDSDGNIKVTPEEIQRMVNDSYQEGYSDGQRNASITVQRDFTPWVTPTWITHPWTITTLTE